MKQILFANESKNEAFWVRLALFSADKIVLKYWHSVEWDQMAILFFNIWPFRTMKSCSKSMKYLPK